MDWLCLVCETINNEDVLKNYSETQIVEIKKTSRCVTCHFYKDEINWDLCLEMNENIDKIFPRHQLDLPISEALVSSIQPQFINMEKTYNYIRLRLRYRNYQIWRQWRKNMFRRRAINRIFKQLEQKYNTQFETSLFLQYLF